jgi:hypothetical protein
MKHISYLLAARLLSLSLRRTTVARKMRRSSCLPSCFGECSARKINPVHAEANVQRSLCGAVRDSESCDISTEYLAPVQTRIFRTHATAAVFQYKL